MIHIGCNGTVLVDVTSAYKLLAKVTQKKDSTGLRTTEIHVYNITEEASDLIYWCTSCDKEVSLDELGFSCRICNKALTIEEGQVALDTGGIWCESCIESKCNEEDRVSLSTIYATDLLILT